MRRCMASACRAMIEERSNTYAYRLDWEAKGSQDRPIATSKGASMKVVISTLVLALVSLVAEPTRAQAFGPEQSKLITEMAESICTTVKEAKGSKTTVQIEAAVDAKLAGFSKRLATAGGTAGVVVKEDRFVGLTQEATAVALASDQSCKFKVFEKMFDRLSPPPDKKVSYLAGPFRDDLRVVQEYVKWAPAIKTDAEACDGPGRSERFTSEFRVSAGLLRLTNYADSDSEKCATGWRSRREQTTTCEAKLDDIDEIVEVGSGPNLTIKCLSGYCFQCTEKGRWRNRETPWTRVERKFQIDYVELHAGTHEYVRSNTTKFNAMGRAVSRIISGGTDSKFCERNAGSCKAVETGQS